MDFEEYSQSTEGIKMLQSLKRKLERRGFDIEDFEDNDLFSEIETAIEAVNARRHFIPKEDMLFEPEYKNIVIRLCICAFAKMGAEGELAHSENGTSRTYTGATEYPNDILREIVPLARLKSI